MDINAKEVIIHQKPIRTPRKNRPKEILVNQPKSKPVVTPPTPRPSAPPPKKQAGGMVSVKGKNFLNTMKANMSLELLKTLALGACGALMYPLVPTLLQAATGSD